MFSVLYLLQLISRRQKQDEKEYANQISDNVKHKFNCL